MYDRSLAATSALCAAVLALYIAAAPLWADPQNLPAASPPVQQHVLDGLIGKHRIIGFTERGGTRFLGRVLSGDHGLYIVQTFHFVSAPATSTETTTQTTYVAGRYGRIRPKTQHIKSQVTTQRTIADDVAVKALLSGVAGPTFRPSELAAQREMIAPTDVVCLQELLPPVTASAPSAAASATVTPSASTPSAPTVARGWTMKTLWASPDLSKAKTKDTAK